MNNITNNCAQIIKAVIIIAAVYIQRDKAAYGWGHMGVNSHCHVALGGIKLSGGK